MCSAPNVYMFVYTLIGPQIVPLTIKIDKTVQQNIHCAIHWIFPPGAFLIPYVMMVLLLGAPLVCLECIMGQYVGIGALPFFDISPLFKGMSLHHMYI